MQKVKAKIESVKEYLSKQRTITHAHGCAASIQETKSNLIIICDAQTGFAREMKSKIYLWKKSAIILMEYHADNLWCFGVCDTVKRIMENIEIPEIIEGTKFEPI